MKTVELTPDKNFEDDDDDEDCDSLQVHIDGKLLTHERGDSFNDIDYESTDAWAVYTVLTMLAKAGVIKLICDPAIVERYAKQPRPFTGPPGPAGMTGAPGKCKCEPRVAKLEKAVAKLTPPPYKEPPMQTAP